MTAYKCVGGGCMNHSVYCICTSARYITRRIVCGCYDKFLQPHIFSVRIKQSERYHSFADVRLHGNYCIVFSMWITVHDHSFSIVVQFDHGINNTNQTCFKSPIALSTIMWRLIVPPTRVWNTYYVTAFVPSASLRRMVSLFLHRLTVRSTLLCRYCTAYNSMCIRVPYPHAYYYYCN